MSLEIVLSSQLGIGEINLALLQYFAGEFGLGLVLVNLLFAWYYWRQLEEQGSRQAAELPSLAQG